MLTKLKIVIDGTAHEIPDSDLKNWADITMSLERKDYGGVTRQFTSEFQFVGSAYELIMNEYIANGVFGKAKIAFYTVTNTWTYDELFSCDLDFTSINHDGVTLGISAVDNSLAACIKSKKSTQYEFAVGKDIPSSTELTYDRVQMTNTANFIITGESIEDSPAMKIESSTTAKRMYVSSTNDDTYENSPILFSDQDETSGSYIIRFEKDCDYVDIESEITMTVHNKLMQIKMYKFNESNPDLNSSYIDIVDLFYSDLSTMLARPYVGLYATEEALMQAYPSPESNAWAIVGDTEDSGIKYYVPKTSIVERRKWINSGKKGGSFVYGSDKERKMEVQTEIVKIRVVAPKAGEQLAIFYKMYIASHPEIETWSTIDSSKIGVTWLSRGLSVPVATIQPEALLNALLAKVCNNTINVVGHISDYDARIAKTYLLAGESIRGIAGAKLYASFNDFADWMAAVFGYTYYLGDTGDTVFVSIKSYSSEDTSTTQEYLNEQCPDTGKSGIVLFSSLHKFLIYNSDTNQYYSQWGDDDYKEWNDVYTGKVRHDMLYSLVSAKRGYYIYFDNDYARHVYDGNIADYDKVRQDVYFVHMTELYGSDVVKTISNITDFSYEIDTELIYATLSVGYDKQDYDKENGRDEWNFSNHYDTDITNVEKKYELISKFRADCYGIEYTAQKRNSDTTDDESDSNVFFAYCNEQTIQTTTVDDDGNSVTTETKTLAIDRSCTITGALTGSVFNGEYSPVKCLEANRQFLSAMKEGLVLRYASSDGNSDIVIDGNATSADVTLTERAFTVGTLSFKTADMKMPDNINGLVAVYHDGKNFTGYITKAEVSLNREDGTKYTIIVKSITQ